MMALNEGFQDYRALVKYEEKVGREEVISLIERLFGGKLSMENYPASYKYIEDLRKTINQNFPL